MNTSATPPAATEPVLELSDVFRFRGTDKEFVFVPGNGAIFKLDEFAARVLTVLQTHRGLPWSEVRKNLKGCGVWSEEQDCLRELVAAGAIRSCYQGAPVSQRLVVPEKHPVGTLVLNVTSKCNLSCGYCYEFGEDQLSKPVARAMDEATARKSVDFLLSQSGNSERVNLTFFGGEPLLNYCLIRTVVAYAREKAEACRKDIRFSLTTNATILTDEMIDFLAEHRFGITVSIDGPREVNDKFRIFSNGQGSFDRMLPHIRKLLERHRTRPIGARVTVARGSGRALDTFDYLMTLGFYEVGIAPVTTSKGRDYVLREEDLTQMLADFAVLARRYEDAAVHDRYMGFSNLNDLLWELHRGVSRQFPCGAGLGLLGVAPNGDISPCHRFVGSAEHDLGNVSRGLDRQRRLEFVRAAGIENKPECHTCFARSHCAGGCHHEAYVRYGRLQANLHYCEWIRSWVGLGLEVYGRILEKNPHFFTKTRGQEFDEAPNSSKS